jgi:cell division protein ZapA
MNEHPVPVSIQILDKEYRVSCAPQEREALLQSARILNMKMREVRDGGKALGIERIAVMTALNIIHECLQNQHAHEQHRQYLERGVDRLVTKIDALLGRRDHKETID